MGNETTSNIYWHILIKVRQYITYWFEFIWSLFIFVDFFEQVLFRIVHEYIFCSFFIHRGLKVKQNRKIASLESCEKIDFTNIIQIQVFFSGIYFKIIMQYEMPCFVWWLSSFWVDLNPQKKNTDRWNAFRIS